jgi:hypothetical protein
MLNPWDDQEQAIRLVRESEHLVSSLCVTTPEEDADDGRFGLVFETTGGRTLRLRLPVSVLASLGQTLLDLAELRRQVA